MKKKALLSSILTIALCLSLIAGSTFALFTSESKVNIAVTSGTVKLTATIGGLELYTPEKISSTGVITNDNNIAVGNQFGKGGTATLTDNCLNLINMIPGDRADAVITLTNESNVAIQYRVIVKSVGEDNTLFEALKITLGEGEGVTSFAGNTIKSEWTPLAVGANLTVPVSVELPVKTGNDYQNKTCELAFTVEAVQGNAEMPDEWDGTSVEAPTQDEAGVYHITNAAEFMALMNSFNDGVVGTWRGAYYDATIELDCNIDLGGAIIERGIPTFFYGKFDGKGHVVSNFILKRVQGANDPDDSGYTGYYTSLFGSLNGSGYVKNLTVENATVVGNKSVSAIVSAMWGGTVENCHVINSTLIGIDQVGAVVAYNGNGIVKDCSATDCSIYYTRTEGDLNEDTNGETLGVIGDNDATATGCTASNVTVEFKKIDEVITTAAEFKTYITELNNNPQTGAHRYDMAHVVLVNDIDLGGAVIEASGEGYMFSGSFDGLGHIVSNYTIKRTDGENYTGLFSVYMQDATIQNLTVKNGTVISNGNQVAAIVSSVYTGSVENCHAIDCTISGVKKVGAVTGYAQTGGTVKNCSAEGCEVYAGNNESINATLFGYNNGGTFTDNVDKGGNTLKTGVTAVTTAADLKESIQKGANILLLNDISVNSWTSVKVETGSAYQPISENITIDGNGHSISGLTEPLLAGNAASTITISNLTIKDSVIASGNENGLGRGAFVAYRDNTGSPRALTLTNCHAINVTVEAAENAGALIGYIGQNDFTIKNCSAQNCTVKSSNGDVGGLIGFCMTDSSKTATITGCTVSGCTLSGANAGQIAGTVNSNGSLTINGCTFSGNAVAPGRIYATVIVDGTTLANDD